jgi:invasion protein IalB
LRLIQLPRISANAAQPLLRLNLDIDPLGEGCGDGRRRIPAEAENEEGLGMNSSSDRWNKFPWLAELASFATCVLTLGTTLAVAQETSVPKRAPTAAAAPAAEGAAWVKLCLKNEQTANKQLCVVNHEGLDPNTGMVLVAAEVRSIEGEDKQHLLVRLPTTSSLVIPAGVQIKIDDGEPISLQYAVCFLTSCQVQMELTKDMFERMRKGKRMVVAAMNMQQKAMAFPVQLTGFGKTFDGPPVDKAKYENGRRQMMEKFRQRQIELANKAAEAEQKKAGPAKPRGQPAANGTAQKQPAPATP